MSYKQLLEDIKREPFVRSVFTEVIFESHIAEIDGKLAMLLFIDGASDIDIVQTVQEKLIPSLENNHGKGSIEEVSTVRILSPVRTHAELHPPGEYRERLHPQRLAGRGDLRGQGAAGAGRYSGAGSELRARGCRRVSAEDFAECSASPARARAGWRRGSEAWPSASTKK